MDKIFERLQFTKKNGLFITKENKWYNIFPKRIEEFFETENCPDAFFCINEKPFILFYENPQDRNKLFKSIWNFNESPIVFIIENDNVEIYNGLKYLKEIFQLSPINEDKIEDFSYFKLVTGKTWGNYQREFYYKNRVDYYLLENIKDARNILSNQGVDNGLANKLIGKTIFTRYLIDRKVKFGFGDKSKYLTNKDFAKILENLEETKQFFSYLQKKFNGDLFSISESEYSDIDVNILEVLRELILGTKIDSMQKSLFDIYDFSIIPVEFISNVYELFIGQTEQASKGAYYTPVFLVDYILSQTVEKYFKDNPKEYNCKILDPACGSGVFLVEAYRKIIKQYEKNNLAVKNNSTEYKEAIIKLAKDNIFGIDKDGDAISVATFSIYLTMLHYQTPPDIENFRFPDLKESNFFEGDFFDEKFDKNEKLNDICFILGNPPWKRGTGKDEKPLYLDYLSKRKRHEKAKRKEENKCEIKISNKEIAQAFLLRTSDLSNENTKCALIVTSKVLYNLKADRFRKYFLENYFIDKVFELAAVRREIFDNSNDPAIAPAAILFYSYANNKSTDKNIIEHIALKPNRLFSMFKIFSIQRNDYKRVTQKKLKDFDYLWKVLVYGSYLDFNFIQRLKNEYGTIGDVISDENEFVVGEGVIIGNNGKYDVPKDYNNKLFLDLKKVTIDNFCINTNDCSLFPFKKIHRNREKNKSIFSSSTLLISRGVNEKLLPKSAILYEDAIFTHAYAGIKSNNNSLNTLKIFNGIFSSFFFSYFSMLTATSLGIEREQIHDKEKWAIPFSKNNKIINLVTKIEQLKISHYEESRKILSSKVRELQNEIDIKANKIDEEVLGSFNLSDEENSLVDYAVNITIPMIMRHKGYENIVFAPINWDDNILKDYVNVFFYRFEETFNKIGLNLSVEVWHNKDILGMFFKETSDIIEDKIKIIDENNDNFLYKISSLGIKKITDKLFIQKDIRGFEETGFYIIKPNEKGLWHKSIAYLDMYEFADAILKAGKEGRDV